ncbi:MAG: hypothetical protein ATN33_01060 [Epulopiscium sp. Nele67-Bin001]|nr:MAG: hypothetical protein BEN18_09480 [Epulopiscium sp. Nuni2H_MBin001]OON91465.1 MAG: hypothetical protein ATN33_01060 [Epulopiscium sp. Nele67-Bin001]
MAASDITTDELRLSIRMFLMERYGVICEQVGDDIFCACLKSSLFLVKEVLGYHGQIFGNGTEGGPIDSPASALEYSCSLCYTLIRPSKGNIRIYLQLLDSHKDLEVFRFAFMARSLASPVEVYNYPKIEIFEYQVAEYCHMLKNKLRHISKFFDLTPEHINIILGQPKETPFFELHLLRRDYNLILATVEGAITDCRVMYQFNDIRYKAMNDKKIAIYNPARTIAFVNLVYRD